MWKSGQLCFLLCLIYMGLKHQSKWHNHASANDFQWFIWIFWVCQLSPAWYNIDGSQIMSRFVIINFNWSSWPWSIIQQENSSMKLWKPLKKFFVSFFSDSTYKGCHRILLFCVFKPLLTHLISRSTFSMHSTNHFFAFQLCFYLSSNNIA